MCTQTIIHKFRVILLIQITELAIFLSTVHIVACNRVMMLHYLASEGSLELYETV